MEPSQKKPMLNEDFLNQGNIMQEEEPAHKNVCSSSNYIESSITI